MERGTRTGRCERPFLFLFKFTTQRGRERIYGYKFTIENALEIRRGMSILSVLIRRIKFLLFVCICHYSLCKPYIQEPYLTNFGENKS